MHNTEHTYTLKTKRKKIKKKLNVPSMSSRHGCGHVLGIGKVSLLTATPYATARVSIPL